MAEFKTIETQEQLDQIIQERLKRNTESVKEQFKDYDELKAKAEEFSKLKQSYDDMKATYESEKTEASEKITSLTSQLKERETSLLKMKVCVDCGLPTSLASRLNGETEEDLIQDAQVFSGLAKKGRGLPPASTERSGEEKDADLKETLKKLRGE